MASSTTYTINVKSKGVKKANRDVKKLKSSIGGLSKAVTGLAIGFGVYKLGGAIINLGKSSIQTAGEFEALRIRLNNMYGSVEKGGKAFEGGVGAADFFREKGILQLIKDSQGIEDLTKLTIPEFREAMFAALADPNSGVVGATDKLSKSWVGVVSNFQDGIDRMTQFSNNLATCDVCILSPPNITLS